MKNGAKWRKRGGEEYGTEKHVLQFFFMICPACETFWHSPEHNFVP